LLLVIPVVIAVTVFRLMCFNRNVVYICILYGRRAPFLCLMFAVYKHLILLHTMAAVNTACVLYGVCCYYVNII